MYRRSLRAPAEIFAAGLALAGNAAAEEAGLPLARAGKPAAVIVVDTRRYPLAQDRTNQWQILERPIRTVAETVAEHVRRSTGVSIGVRPWNVRFRHH